MSMTTNPEDPWHTYNTEVLDLLETLDNPMLLPSALWQSWIEFVTTLIQRAVTEGDAIDKHDPEDIARMVVGLWEGIRRTSNLDEPEQYLDNLKKIWILALPSFTNPDRIDYFAQFIQRRHTLAVKKVSAEAPSADLHATAAVPAHTDP